MGQANVYWGLGLRLLEKGAMSEAKPMLARAVDLAHEFAPDHPVTQQWVEALEQVRAAIEEKASEEDAG